MIKDEETAIHDLKPVWEVNWHFKSMKNTVVEETMGWLVSWMG